MSKQEKSLVGLASRGHIFGLGAFRRYKEITGEDVGHFEQALSSELDSIEANYRWAVMLKCANDVYVNINGGDKISVDEYTVLLSDADQSISDNLMKQYLDTNYLGKPMREYYGIPAAAEETKKKSTAQGRRTRKP